MRRTRNVPGTDTKVTDIVALRGSKVPIDFYIHFNLNKLMKNLKTFLSLSQLSDLKNTFHGMFCVKAGRGLYS
jgi:hypothetical protein